MRGTSALAACLAVGGETLESLSSRVEQMILQPQASSSQLEILNTRLDNLSLERTYVGSSSIAGRGLFAAVDCPKGTLLTCYPGDGIVDDEEQEVFWGDHVPDEMDDGGNHWDADYLMYLTEEIGLIGLPQLDQDPAYLGHFANDGISKIPQTMQDVFSTYLEESTAQANAREQEILNGCHMALVATRDLAKDQEIFLCYGPEYWIQQAGFGGTQ